MGEEYSTRKYVTKYTKMLLALVFYKSDSLFALVRIPFSKAEWSFERTNSPLKMVDTLKYKDEATFKMGISPSQRMIHHLEE